MQKFKIMKQKWKKYRKNIIQQKYLAISIVMMMLRIIYEKNCTITRPKG